MLLCRRTIATAVVVLITLSACASIGQAGEETIVHEVQRGDTLWLLGHRYGVTVQEIMVANNLNSHTIYPGMRLVMAGAVEVEGAQALTWAVVNGMFARNSVAEVMDVRTGLTFQVMRRGGWAHADVEPVSRQDTEIMREAYGGAWSWARRPVVVTIGGVRIAASINGMPHGGQSIRNNNFPGHNCIHFLNSTTHATRSLDRAHQNAVREAVGH